MMIKLAQNDHFRVNECQNILILILLEMDRFFCSRLLLVFQKHYVAKIFQFDIHKNNRIFSHISVVIHVVMIKASSHFEYTE